MSSEKIPQMNELEYDIFSLVKEISPNSLYVMGIEEYGESIWLPTKDNIEKAINRIKELKNRCPSKTDISYKYLDSLECILEWDEPEQDVGLVVEVLSAHLIKEGFNVRRLKVLEEKLCNSLDASLSRISGRNYPTAVRILGLYQVFGALEILNVIKEGSKDEELSRTTERLREKVDQVARTLAVEGFTDGQFEQVRDLLLRDGPSLGREKFYPRALHSGFDYKESPAELERKALLWLRQELPMFRKATRQLAKKLGCKPQPEEISAKLRSRSGVTVNDSLPATLKVRPIVQALVAESICGINPNYSTTVVETPTYISAIIPSAAAQSFDTLTNNPKQRYYITTDTRRAPIAGFAAIVNTLVHEEYGHCVHFSNTATEYSAKPGILSILPSLHGGATSEGLSFQREFEFLQYLERLAKKNPKKYTLAERNYVQMTEEYGGFDATLLELRFETYSQRIIRFLRVIGDSRINSGKQDLIKFLSWAEKMTGLSARTVFYQLFPAHESIFPGYATCYAVVGQDIRSVQKPFRNNSKKMARFNAYATSIGSPPRSIYMKLLKKFANQRIK